MENFEFTPIGYVCCQQQYRYEAPRQGVFANNVGVIKLNPGKNFEQALTDLAGFERLWVIYCFHLNHSWKPLVRPPVTGDKEKISLFATRSPHRPNPIGLSCVELIGIDKLEVHIRNFDMLDQTPVLDLKPYIPSADAFPDAGTGWLESATSDNYTVIFSQTAAAKTAWILNVSGLDIVRFCNIQLAHDPLNSSRKRVTGNDKAKQFTLACRTWRIRFNPELPLRQVVVEDIESGYSDEELNSPDDPYLDKGFHREFRSKFNPV